MSLGEDSLGERGQDARSEPGPACYGGNSAKYQCYQPFLSSCHGKFQTYANVLKPFLDTFSVPATVMPSGTSRCLRDTLTSWSPRPHGGHGIQPTSSICESVVMSGHGWTHCILGDTAAVLSRPDHALSQSLLQTPGGAGPAPTGGVSLTSGTGHPGFGFKIGEGVFTAHLPACL